MSEKCQRRKCAQPDRANHRHRIAAGAFWTGRLSRAPATAKTNPSSWQVHPAVDTIFSGSRRRNSLHSCWSIRGSRDWVQIDFAEKVGIFHRRLFTISLSVLLGSNPDHRLLDLDTGSSDISK
jgi:hypothetical protein